MFCSKVYTQKFPECASVVRVKFSNVSSSRPRSDVGQTSLAPANLGLSLDWRNVLCEAEKTVGYPTSFLDLRWLFNDEIANTAIHLRKLVSTNNPLMKSTKNLLLGPKSNLQSHGLIILLVSKAAGFDPKLFPSHQYDSGLLQSQRALAEIVEMKRTGHLIHQTICNLQEMEKYGEQAKDLLYGNKIALLMGDYIIATSINQHGSLRNSEVSELIYTGLRDLIEGDFIGERDSENKPVPSEPKDDTSEKKYYDWEHEDNLQAIGSNEYLGQAKDEWILRTMLTSGSILGKGCQGAMKLAKLDKVMENKAYVLGGHLALTWQLYLDIKDFFVHTDSYSLVGAPVMFAIEEYPQIYEKVKLAKTEHKLVNFRALHKDVRSTKAIEKTRDFLENEIEACSKVIESFHCGDAKVALQKMIVAVHTEAMGYIEYLN